MLSSAPRGWPPDHPRIDRLRMKQLAVYRRQPLAGWLHKRECDRRVARQLAAARPLVAWLRKHVGASRSA